MTSNVYVHLDSIANAVSAHGMSLEDFAATCQKPPKNLLLLDAASSYGEYEPHTALPIIRGEQNVLEYFKEVGSRKNQSVKWIDFSQVAMLNELTPIEISELLYLGHMRTPLHSPFFYKLQNEYAFFYGAEGFSRSYYRHMEDFYRLLTNRIQNLTAEKASQKRGFFKKSLEVKPMSTAFLKELKNIFQEGVIFDFSQIGLNDQKYQIPLYVVEDKYHQALQGVMRENMLVGVIEYQSTNGLWQFAEEADFLLNVHGAG